MKICASGSVYELCRQFLCVDQYRNRVGTQELYLYTVSFKKGNSESPTTIMTIAWSL